MSKKSFFDRYFEKKHEKEGIPVGGKKLQEEDINQVVKAEKKPKNNNKVTDKKKKYVQDTIPYSQVYEDGIISNEQGVYSKTYPILDVHFKIESEDVQENIWLDYQDLLNSFSSDVHIQISTINRFLEKDKFHDMILTKMQSDAQDKYRKEFNDVLISKEDIGDNELVKNRYLTIGVQADSIEVARQKFLILDKTIDKALNKINKSVVKPLTTVERLKIMHDFYNAGQESEFLAQYIPNDKKNSDVAMKDFDLRILTEAGISTKDVIAPDYFEFGKEKMIIGDKYAQALCVQDYPTTMNTDFLVGLNNVKCPMITSLHCDIVDRVEAAKKVAALQTTINAMVSTAQQKVTDPTLISQKLQYERDAIKEYRDDIQKESQRLFQTSIIIVHMANSLQELANQEEQIKTYARTKMVRIISLKEQQERALNAVVPLGYNEVSVRKTLKTKELAILIPFELQEMTQPNGFYYGLNTESKRLILYNRRNGDNYNGLILGRSGSGKSFKAKEEILSSYLGTNDDVIILDPQGEYAPFVKSLGGEAINFFAGCGTHINPFDMDLSYADEGNEYHTNPLVLKNSYIGSICEIAAGGRYGLSQGQQSIIDRVLAIIYAKFLETGDQKYIPTMQDFYYALSEQPEMEAQAIARPMEQFATGSLDLFAHHTNVVLTNRLTCYNIKGLTNPALKNMALVACLNDIWNRVLENRKKGKFTWIYMDEFHLFLKSAAVSDFLMSIWKRARAFGGGPTGITQNISDLLMSQAAETIFANSSCIVMLNQAPNDRMELANMLNISETQQRYIDNAKKGSGLLWTGQAIIPFEDEFPKNTELYRMMSTDATESLSELQDRYRSVVKTDEQKKEDEKYEEYQAYQKELMTGEKAKEGIQKTEFAGQEYLQEDQKEDLSTPHTSLVKDKKHDYDAILKNAQNEPVTAHKQEQKTDVDSPEPSILDLKEISSQDLKDHYSKEETDNIVNQISADKKTQELLSLILSNEKKKKFF